MNSLEKYRDEVLTQIANGVNFEKSDWLSDAAYFDNLAAKYSYRRPKNAYFGRGRCFYQLLQRVYNRMKTNGEIKK